MDTQIQNWKNQIADIDKLITEMRGVMHEQFMTEHPGVDPILNLRHEQAMITDMIVKALNIEQGEMMLAEKARQLSPGIIPFPDRK